MEKKISTLLKILLIRKHLLPSKSLLKFQPGRDYLKREKCSQNFKKALFFIFQPLMGSAPLG